MVPTAEDEFLHWIRGPGPVSPETEKTKTTPCFGCGKPLRPGEERMKARRKHPVCRDCYLEGDAFLWKTCTRCGAVAKRTMPGTSTFVCSRHEEGLTP